MRAPYPSANATTGLFRPVPALLLFVTRFRRDPGGQPLVPGNLEVWSDILRQKSDSHIMRQWGKRGTRLTNPDQLVQTMFAFSRATSDYGPLQIYTSISELESRRSPEHRLAHDTVRLLACKCEDFSDEYRIFSEFPDLSDACIVLFLETAEALNNAPHPVRGNALGTFEATVGIWQILARQGQISNPHLDVSWQQTIRPFARILSVAQMHDPGRNSSGHIIPITSVNTTNPQ